MFAIVAFRLKERGYFDLLVNNMFDAATYPLLHKSTHLLSFNENPLLGSDHLLHNMLAAMHKTSMSNVLLIADAGNGKSATVQEFAKRYKNQYIVLETSIAQMEDGGVEYLASNFKRLLYEMSDYRKKTQEKRELVLFIDELHQLPMASPAAVEDLKPELARSGSLGLHIVGATTYDEFHQYIEHNMALMQRFQTLKMPLVDDELTFKILKSMMRGKYKNDVQQSAETDRILREIIYYTDTYIKARVQPRKSLDILDTMVANTKIGAKFDHKLLAQVIYDETHVRIDLQLDPKGLENYLNSRVYNQTLAVKAIVGNAYSAILGITDDTKPRGAFLFVGPTGVGKTELAKAFTTGMFGPDAKLTTFDMAEYHNDDMVDLFHKRLTQTVLSIDTPVILLDEIEKANPSIGTLLFSVLDEARLSDVHGREVNFSNIFFLFTTNAGDSVFDAVANRDYTDKEATEALERFRKTVFRNLEHTKNFPTPLLGRMTGFIPFNPMNDESNRKIAKRTLKKMAHLFMQKQNVKVRYNYDTLIPFVTHEKLDKRPEAGGARQIKTIARRDVINNVSRYLIFNPKVSDIYVTTTGDSRYDHKQILISEEHVTVSPTAKDIIANDYQFAKTKFSKPIGIRFKRYQKIGLKFTADLNKIFHCLARIDLGDPADEITNNFFAPVDDYINSIVDWHKAYGKMQNPPYPCPSLKIHLTVANNELIIEQK